MTSIRNLASASSIALAAVLISTSGVQAQGATSPAPMARGNTGSMHTKMVGGAAMYPNKTIVENAANSKDHTTLVAAVKAAGLVDTLSGPGPFTVFAPTNEAFAKLPTGTVDTLVKPESHDTLVKILTYHVVPGALTAADLTDGKVLTTVQGETLTVHRRMGHVTLSDAKGGMSRVTIADVMQSNGVIDVVDTVLMP